MTSRLRTRKRIITILSRLDLAQARYSEPDHWSVGLDRWLNVMGPGWMFPLKARKRAAPWGAIGPSSLILRDWNLYLEMVAFDTWTLGLGRLYATLIAPAQATSLPSARP